MLWQKYGKLGSSVGINMINVCKKDIAKNQSLVEYNIRRYSFFLFRNKINALSKPRRTKKEDFDW